jgi:Cu-Zn family superoxide dismutase
MKLASVTAFAVAALAFSGCATTTTASTGDGQPRGTDAPPAPSSSATATILSRSNTETAGTAQFSLRGKDVTLQLFLSKLAPGTHAVHIHEKGDCSAADASSAGPHWNPTSQAHGQWGHATHHLGDIGNVQAGADGTATLSLTTDRWSIGDGGPGDIIGKAVVVHAGVDDFTSQPAGNAGGRVGCGVITQGR